MIVAELSPEELRNKLRNGMRLRTGPLVTQIQTELPDIVSGIALHYAQHPIEASSGFADFHVRIAKPRGLRHWLQPQVLFFFDNEPPFHPLPADQAFPMLEWGLNWCVSNWCHQYISIHAAVVERNGKALMLPAPPGSGKSTLCAGLIQRGWRLLSDELALIDPTTLEICPLPRPVSLKNASIEVIKKFAPAVTMNTPVHDTIKGTVAHMSPPTAAVARATEKAMPGWLVLPQYIPQAPATLAPLSKARGLMALIENSFNFNLHGEQGFSALADWIDASESYTFSYSSLEEAVEIFDALAGSPATR